MVLASDFGIAPFITGIGRIDFCMHLTWQPKVKKTMYKSKPIQPLPFINKFGVFTFLSAYLINR